VYGVLERGKKIVNRNAECASALKAISKHLNLMQHAVKGSDDMTVTFVQGAADLQIYKGTDEKFYPTKFERALPPEDTKQIAHFKTSSRGMAIMWRLLRPEILKTGPSPVSPDSYSLFSDSAGPDQADIHDSVCDKATDRLLRVVIPAFAEELCKWPGDQDVITTISWSREMHSRGINLRHLGFLRSMFWHELSGRVSVTYSETCLRCDKDWRIELPRDSRFRVRVEHEHSEYKGFRLYTLDPSQDWTQNKIFIKEAVNGPPENGVRAFAGLVSKFESSKSIRDSLLVEICVRTIKAIINLHAREMAKTQKIITEKSFSDSFVKYLNLVTGASSESEQWWNNDVRMMIAERFGSCALGETEKWRLNVCLQPHLKYLVQRLCETFCVEMHSFCMNRFFNEPVHFRFEFADLIKLSARIRLNVEPTFHFANGSLLKAEAEERVKFSYRGSVLSHDPIAYVFLFLSFFLLKSFLSFFI